MRLQLLFAAVLAVFVSACNASGTNQGIPATGAGTNAVGSTAAGPNAAHSNARVAPAVDSTSVLKLLTKQEVIGSTVDPTNGDQNPYGLVYVSAKPFGNGKLKKGDLVVCNYNDKNNVQGNGTTMDYLSSTPGSSPHTFVQSSTLLGCSSLVINSLGQTFSTDSQDKNVAGWSPKGTNLYTFTNSAIITPWSSAYMPSLGYPPGDGIFVSDAYTGGITRVNLGGLGSQPSITDGVIRGFPVNHGQPGTKLAPSGLQYDKKGDTLYVLDGVNNTVYAFKNAYNGLINSKSVIVGKNGKSFTGPGAKDARVVFSGKPLNGPISMALLPNGNLVVENTLDPSGTNLMVEIESGNGTVLDTKNVDTGAAGALFGIVAVGSSDSNTVIYFNDDNANNVQLLTR